MSDALQQAAKEYLVRYGGDVFPNLFRSAKGTIVTDSSGREYLDFTSGQMCATIGHNHPAIVEAVNRAGKKAFHFFSGMIPEVVVELAQTLARDWLPGDLKRSIFRSTAQQYVLPFIEGLREQDIEVLQVTPHKPSSVDVRLRIRFAG